MVLRLNAIIDFKDKDMSRHLFGIITLVLITISTVHAETQADVTGKTVEGDEIVLHPNGYWEYKDAKKAEVAKTNVEAYEKANSNGCPPGSRPGFLGFGRCIAYDDPVLKRGSLSYKGH